MRRVFMVGVLLSLVLLGSMVLAQDVTPEPTTEATAEAGTMMSGAQADILDVNNAVIGQMILVDAGNNKVVVQAQLTGLTPGWHGIHLHQTGTCDPAGDTPFASAGTHWTLGGENHPDHTGDLPSLLVGQDGTARLAFETDRFAINDLFDTDGTAVMVHSNADNFANIPERYGTPDEDTLSHGDAGTRVACGVVVEAAPAQ